MKYRMQRGNYKDFEIYEQNKRAPRAYFIPYGDEEVLRATPMARQRYTSDLVRVLSGAWDFRYYADARELPKELDTEEMVFDQVQVPSTWQRTGYEPPVYLNCPYEFESPMPEMPEQVPCGIYRKLFTLEETHNRSFLLSFLGAAACLDVFLNGYHVGYSEGAHNTAEFDISGMAAPGENELLVAVHKWSTGTYLECQDMFRESGIFRDVLLYDLPKTYLTDVFAKPQRLPDGGYRLQVTAEVLGECGGWSLEFAIDGLEASFSGAAKERVSFTLDLPEVIEWNAEQPKLYQAWLRLKKDGALSQTVNLPIGFKTVQIKKNIFLFNGKKIKFKGVNHHDTDPVTGYCMRYEDYLKDLTLMKALNVNAIRTAHYPPDPHLLMLADEMGFYVVDEADIETHGAEFPPHNDFHLVSHDKRWIPRYLDRVKRMLFRDRNHACVTMWSLGNEAGGHHCQDACYAFLHAVHPEIPVHYESVVHTPVYAYDVYSEMYTPHAKLERIGKQKEDERFRGKPFFLCEYAHAMGVGPGGLAEYGDLFLAYETLMGGCIWEWADHAVDHGEGAALRYTYGGDHGERKHDGNFCVDGLVYPDRRPHTGAYAMKNVYRPIRAAAKGGGRFVFTNTNRFKSAYGIHVEWLLDENGAPKASGSFALACEAEQSEEVQLWLDEFAPQTDVHILFRYLDGAGEEIAAEQITLQECYVPEELPAGTQLSLTEDAEQYIIRTQGASLRFGKASAALESYQQPEGQELLCGASLVPNLLRAKLDNDKCLERRLEETGLDQMEMRPEGITAVQAEDQVRVKAAFSVRTRGLARFTVTVESTVTAGGALEVRAGLAPTQDMDPASELARFGLTLRLAKELEQLCFYGLGGRENLPDLRAQAYYQVEKTTVDALHEPYIKPQDNGNRGEVRWLNVHDAAGKGLRITNAPQKFSFSAHHYTQASLAAAAHQEELRKEDVTFLSVDGFMRGTGTGSCGPDVLEQYCLDVTQPISFSFALVPLS